MPIIRYSETAIDDSDPGVAARRLVSKHTGANTFTAGISVFAPNADILLHTHPCEEIVVILDGTAVAELNGERYNLERFDLSLVPPGVPHRFLNQSDAPFTMMYVYPTTEVTRDPADSMDDLLS